MHQPMPVNEADRLAGLALYEVVDTPPEFAYDALTELAAQICICPVARISMLEERRQWFKSKYGFPADFAECPREVTVCNTTICSNDLLYVQPTPVGKFEGRGWAPINPAAKPNTFTGTTKK